MKGILTCSFQNNYYIVKFDCKKNIQTFIIIAIYEFLFNFHDTFWKKKNIR